MPTVRMKMKVDLLLAVDNRYYFDFPMTPPYLRVNSQLQKGFKRSMAINHILSRNILVVSSLHCRQCEGTAVNIVWVPYHVGISGYELAYKGAKEVFGAFLHTYGGIRNCPRGEGKNCEKGRRNSEWRTVVNNKLSYRRYCYVMIVSHDNVLAVAS
ncbi:hypothetical protein J6590_060848 [Homalodisca vitripennis]|nr:hypothetical protein J6590_060848 [Homalodisca vitripennis]